MNKLNPTPDIKPNTKPSDSHDDNGNNIGVSISSGELSNLITKSHESFHQKFLTLLHRPYRAYVLNAEAIGYLREHEFAKKWQRILAQYQDVHFLSEKARKTFMNDIGLTGSRNHQRASEAMLYGSLISHGFNLVT
ncbi:hypothetical protein [Endozoicomonas sp. SCSIO W0465]|uniref:hypothetical protein n=1 Tax=Endozoicomonas sp. SCSIO W0465 TaxID=2918516 RepID=UPI002074C3AD|nr:hypothetical protein [Endozoicomonas sp. SCSIO W0465]USE36291.1 hypothetical protein MJO57_30410 [Endozoicomonas sp. SCSIO W0465]